MARCRGVVQRGAIGLAEQDYAHPVRLVGRLLDDIQATIARYGMDCDFERTGVLSVLEPHQVERLARPRGKLLKTLDALGLGFDS